MELPSTETQQLWVEQIWRNMRGAILDMSCLLDTHEEKVEYVVGCESLTFTAKVQVGD
jgi:hypothetical protein